MITIISATNRNGNYSILFAQKCKEILDQKGIECQLFNLDDIPSPLALRSVYDYKNSVFADIAQKIIAPAEKFIFVVPEYNGSFPGILKMFIDAVEPQFFRNKKAALIGVSSGRAGNLRGMDHLQDVLHYLFVTIMPPKLPISSLHHLVEGDEIIDEVTLKLIEEQVDRLIEF